jgi:hypothetical protein
MWSAGAAVPDEIELDDAIELARWASAFGRAPSWGSWSGVSARTATQRFGETFF